MTRLSRGGERFREMSEKFRGTKKFFETITNLVFQSNSVISVTVHTRSPTARFNSFHLLHTEMTLPHLSTTAPGTLDVWFVVTKDSL